jgi:hypothetical protein
LLTDFWLVSFDARGKGPYSSNQRIDSAIACLRRVPGKAMKDPDPVASGRFVLNVTALSLTRQANKTGPNNRPFDRDALTRLPAWQNRRR